MAHPRGEGALTGETIATAAEVSLEGLEAVIGDAADGIARARAIRVAAVRDSYEGRVFAEMEANKLVGHALQTTGMLDKVLVHPNGTYTEEAEQRAREMGA